MVPPSVTFKAAKACQAKWIAKLAFKVRLLAAAGAAAAEYLRLTPVESAAKVPA
jgi:hypothetical protein